MEKYIKTSSRGKGKYAIDLTPNPKEYITVSINLETKKIRLTMNDGIDYTDEDMMEIGKTVNLLVQKEKMKDVIYICSSCAEGLGAVWPECLCATFHTDICKVCGEEKSLAHVDDWDWPNKLFIYSGHRD